jgi:hypothetical protein
VRDSKLLAACREGSLDGSAAQSAAVLVWTADSNSDGLIQGAELALIEHDTNLRQLVVYPSGQGDDAQPLAWAIINDPMVIVDFKRGRTGYPIARGVYGAAFAVTSATSSTLGPTLEFALALRHEKRVGATITTVGQSYTEYGTCVVRAPLPVPS